MFIVYYSCRCFATYTSNSLPIYEPTQLEKKPETVVYKGLKWALLVPISHKEKPGS